MSNETTPEAYDVVVVGGGAAGLSGAVALARFRRSVLVVDGGEPRNAPAGHVHNFLTRDGTPPGEIYALGRAELVSYGGRVEAGQVTAVRGGEGHFEVEVGERVVSARRVLLATGLQDELPDVPGLAEGWGHDVLHCPYCHGWEVRDQRIGVLSTSPMSTHQALLFRQLSPQVTLLQHTGPAPEGEVAEQLHALGIEVVPGEVTEVRRDADGALTGVQVAGGREVALDALVVGPRFRARAELVAPLGLTPAELVVDGYLVATEIPADASGATAVPGLWVAGNVADAKGQVITSAAAGLTAAAAMNASLVEDDARAAVHAHHGQQIVGQTAWDERYRERDQIWSGHANPVLVDEVADLTPGTALDAGCGEGGDTLWLAQAGWKATGMDLSPVALERAAAQSDRLGLAVDWQHRDLAQEPAGATYDLVSAFFVHMPADARRSLWKHLAEAVAPGGTLLVVGHDFRDHAVMPRPALLEMGWSTSEVVSALDDGWAVVVDEARPRRTTHPNGHEVTIHDAVLRAVRHPA